MRKVIVSNLVSLDGFFEGPNKELDWFIVDEEFFDFARKQLFEVDTILFGRVAYEMMAAYWPNTIDNDPVITDKMNNLQKVIFSKTLSGVEWNNSVLIKGNIAEEITRLKQQPGKDMVIFGSGDLVSFLVKGLHDKINLKLSKSKTLGSGVVILYYVLA